MEVWKCVRKGRMEWPFSATVSPSTVQCAVCVSATILALQATRQLAIYTHSFGATSAQNLNCNFANVTAFNSERLTVEDRVAWPACACVHTQCSARPTTPRVGCSVRNSCEVMLPEIHILVREEESDKQKEMLGRTHQSVRRRTF